MNAGNVVIAIKAVDEASNVFSKIQASMGILGNTLGQLGGGFAQVGSVISGFAAGGPVGAAVAGLGQVVQGLQWATAEATKTEQSWADLQASLRLTGPAWDEAKAKVGEFASALQRTTTFSDEMVVGAVQRMATFGMSYQQGMAAVSTAVELAAAKHIDLQTATDLLGKAFMGNTAILSRYGINIDEIKKGMAKGATDAQVYEAVLTKLNAQFGGTAAAQAQTYAGAQERLKNAMSDMGEKIGGILLPALAGVTEAMIPLVDWFTKGIGQVQDWITAVGKMPEVKAATDAVGTAFSGLQKWFGDVSQEVVTALGPALKELWGAFKEILDALAPLGEAFGEIWAAFSDGQGSGSALKDLLWLLVAAIKDIAAVIRAVVPVIKMFAEGFKEAADFIAPIITTLRETIGGFLTWLHDSFDAFYKWLVGGSMWQDMWGQVLSVALNMAGQVVSQVGSQLFGALQDIFNTGMATMQKIWQAGFDQLTSIATTAYNALMGQAQQTANSIMTTIQNAISSATGAAQSAVSSIIGSLQSAWSAVTSAVSSATAPSIPLGSTGVSNQMIGRSDFGPVSSTPPAIQVTVPVQVTLDSKPIAAVVQQRIVTSLREDRKGV